MEPGFKNLTVYKLGYKLAMTIFALSKTFPREETYALTDQIRRSSRAVCSNLSEAYRKRIYQKHFVSKLTDCEAECSETQVWLDFAKDCKYISENQYEEIMSLYKEIGSLLGDMINNPEKYMDKRKMKNTNL